MKTEILNASVRFFRQPFLKPLKLSSGAITEITEARASVTVRCAGREATGRGAMYLSDLWAWPESSLDHARRDAILRQVCETLAGRLLALCGGESAHPLELGLRLHHAVTIEPFDGLPASPPVLARALCASPFDAALHDAAGQALGKSAFEFYDEPDLVPSADSFFRESSAVHAIKRIIEKPRDTLDAWWIVCPGDSMTEYVAPAVRRHGFRCFKLKTRGKDNAEDVRQTVDTFRALKTMGVEQPRLSIDSNEGNPDAASVGDYLERLRAADDGAFQAIQYLEQPTKRDILGHRFDWNPVTRLKPVLLDEGLTSLEIMKEAVAQGWSGFALKTCKGHSFALTAAAWAREHGLLLALQDLTNPGLAAIHAALFAARIPMLNGVELNSSQYTPAANADWLPRLKGLFVPEGGLHHVADLQGPGLGSTL